MTMVDTTERLMAEFEDRLDLSLIVQVVAGCRRDLQGGPAGAEPELVERLARQRLLDLAAPAVPVPRRPVAVPSAAGR